MSRFLRIFILLPVLLICFAACDTGGRMDLRLFCENYSETAAHQARLEPAQFIARPREDGCKYEAYITQALLLTLDTLQDGQIHTVSLTALPEITRGEFRRAALDIVKTYCGGGEDAIERWLNSVYAGEAEVLGYHTAEENGFRLSYAANAAGRYLRVSRLRDLPEEPELPTLKEYIEETSNEG